MNLASVLVKMGEVGGEIGVPSQRVTPIDTPSTPLPTPNYHPPPAYRSVSVLVFRFLDSLFFPFRSPLYRFLSNFQRSSTRADTLPLF